MRMNGEKSESPEREGYDKRQRAVTLWVPVLEFKITVITSKFSRPKILTPLIEQG